MPAISKRITLDMFCLFAIICCAACSGAPETSNAAPSASPTSVEAAARDNDMRAAPAEGKSPSAAAVANEPLMSEAALEAYTKRCSECHGPDGRGMTSLGAPDMRVSPRRDAGAWAKFLRDPASVTPATTMKPVRGMTDADVEALAGYLADLTQNNPPPQTP